MTNSGAREQLFYEAPRGTRITSIKTTDIEKMNWFTWTGVLGLVCEGIWPPETDITDINSTDLTKDKQILATADDFGLVKLFDFPAKVNRLLKRILFVFRLNSFILFVKGKFAKFKRYAGHSAHVTRVRWTHDDNYLISIGGRDVAAIVWKHEGQRAIEITPSLMTRKSIVPVSATPNGNAATTTPMSLALKQERGESDDSDNTDSEEEGYDSDVQHDRKMDYNARFLINPIRAKTETNVVHHPTTNRKPM